ncbi:MAG: SH3 domain-containing protein [Lachnospiraceae bacterium]|nr:SH3 domain-containing protein [Lachnospiraceae bacterium]
MKRKKRRMKQMKQKLIPVIVAVALIIIIAGITVCYEMWNKYFNYANTQADLNQYFNVSTEGEAAIVLQNELIDTKAYLHEGTYYLKFEDAKELLNHRYYYDSNEGLLVYTTATDVYISTIGAGAYEVNGELVYEDHPITYLEDGQLYISLEHMRRFTNFSYEVFSDPDRIQIRNAWGDVEIGEVKDDSAVRIKGGIKSDVLRHVDKGEVVTILEKMDDWARVKTSDAIIGYIENDDLKDIKVTTEVPVNDAIAPEYTCVHKDYRINMAWHAIYAESGNETFDSLVNGTGTMSIICPTWFALDGNDGYFTDLSSADYVKRAHDRNMEVWAVLDNVNHPVETYQVLAYTSKRRRLVADIMERVDTLGLDGINLDFELLKSDTIESYIEFVREMSVECRKRGIVLSVDNYSPEGGANFGLAEQGNVVDYVVIMGYDEHWNGGDTAGSVASIGFVERGINLVMQEVPEEKIINAIPFYTRVWKTNGSELTSEALGMEKTAEFIRTYDIPVEWDDTTCQNYGEKEMNGTLYQVWIEDARSIETKLTVMSKYDLAGVAEWQLGMESKDIWPVLDAYVKH